MSNGNIHIDKSINLLHIVELLILIGIGLMAFSTLQSNVAKLEENQEEIKERHEWHEQHVQNTYVRQDVFNQILIRLEDINESINDQ